METPKPKLDDLQKFERLLRSYRPSGESIRKLKQTRLLLLVAPTSSGRNTIINELLKTGLYRDLITDTTRPKRYNDNLLERDGVEYWFCNEKDMYNDLIKGKYLEAAVIHSQQVSGVSLRELELAHKQNKIAIADIEIVGAKKIYSYSSDVMLVFVLPPSFDEWMRRFKHRGVMSEDERRRRLKSALNEISMALSAEAFIFVINDNLQDTVAHVHAIAKGQALDSEYIAAARNHAEQLYIEIQTYLGE